MTDEQKRYIEHNIELIENNEWAKFFSTLMRGLGGIIYEAGIDFMTELGYVPRGAFKDSNVQRVVIPDGVTEIGYYAFQDCTSLKNVTIGNGVNCISQKEFFNCKSLVSVTISHGVISIEDEAFHNCMNLTNVSIPNSVNRVGRDAFSNCGNININYTGTVAEWKTLIGNNSKVFKYTTYTCTCTDGVIRKSR